MNPFARLRRRLRRKRTPPGCRSCGVCCEIYGHALRATAEDLSTWKARGRLDLLLMVGEGGKIWADRSTGELLEDCPFLQRTGPDSALCRIHEIKPSICRGYPTRVHGFRCVRGVRFPGEPGSLASSR